MEAESGLNLNLERVLHSTSQYHIASDKIAKKLIQVALKTMFRLRKDKPDKDLVVKIAIIDDELKKNGFKDLFWFEANIFHNKCISDRG